MIEPIVIGGRFFIYDEDAHAMIETDADGVPLAPETQRSAE